MPGIVMRELMNMALVGIHFDVQISAAGHRLSPIIRTYPDQSPYSGDLDFDVHSAIRNCANHKLQHMLA